MATKPDDQLSAEAKAMRETAPAFNAFSRLVSAVIAGTGIGWALEHWQVIGPGQGLIWGPAVGGVVGLSVFVWTASNIKTKPPGTP
ncbi:MAG: hypothetical protein JNG84_11075 [Archangium sp.]|nr:hypothetical protein [Archangium sp.]